MATSLHLQELAAALTEYGQFGRVTAADLQPLRSKGITHDHLRIRGLPGVLIRVPRQSQFAVSAEENLSYQTACFGRAWPSGHTPRLIATLQPRSGLAMGALLVQEIRGRPMRLPQDLHKTAAAMAAIHRLAVPAPGDRPPLVDHADPAASMLEFIEEQWRYREAVHASAESRALIEEELAWARSFVASNASVQPVALILFDSHPGNFLIDESDRAVFIDLEKLLYGSPAADLAQHTLYTATTWDVDCAGVLTPEATQGFYDAYFRALPTLLAEAIRPWVEPMRRLTWLRTITWALKWRALSTPSRGDERGEDWSSTPMPPAYRTHVAARIGDFLAPETITRIRQEWISRHSS
jgi:Ser/Thr protein kinase RdoA (MazF antagonist)